MMKRLGIYVIYDKDGIVDDYVTYFLGEFRRFTENLLIICNGKLGEEGRKKLENFTDGIIVRENRGFDIWGYKTGLDHYGWKRLEEYDEVVLCNDTVIGPIYPFQEMFETMAGKDVDFWGITRHYPEDDNYFKTEFGYMPEHIQSYFLVMRRTLVSSEALRDFWDHLPQISSYRDAVGKFELVFTKRFSDLGFRWDTYVDTAEYKDRSVQPVFDYALELVRDQRCPVAKKRLFFTMPDEMWYAGVHHQPVALLRYIRESTEYPVSLLVRNLLRIKKLKEICNNLDWNHVIPETGQDQDLREELCRKTLIIVSISGERMLSELKEALMPLSSKISILLLHEGFEAAFFGDLQNLRTGDMAHGIRNGMIRFLQAYGFWKEYEYCAFLRNDPAEVSRAVNKDKQTDWMLRNMIPSAGYVQGVLDLFESDPDLGFLTPYRCVVPRYEEGNSGSMHALYTRILRLHDALKLKSSPEDSADAMFQTSGCFWFRTKALIRMQEAVRRLDPDPCAEEFQSEEADCAFTRLLPYAVQDAGFTSGYITAESSVREELSYFMFCSDRLRRDYREIKESFSWRITAPVRKARDFWMHH